MRQRGVTLIEVVVVVTIIGLLLLAGMPSVSEFLRNQRVRTAAEAIQSGLQQARTEAVRRNTSVGFWLVSLSDPNSMDNSCALSSGSSSWVVSINSPAGKCAASASTTIDPMLVASRAAGDSGSAITVVATQSDGATAANSVTFNGFGQVNGAAAISRIKITTATSPTSNRQLRVDVSSGGQVRMCDLGVTDTTDPRYCTP